VQATESSLRTFQETVGQWSFPFLQASVSPIPLCVLKNRDELGPIFSNLSVAQDIPRTAVSITLVLYRRGSTSDSFQLQSFPVL
jgi:hypothetical protein